MSPEDQAKSLNTLAKLKVEASRAYRLLEQYQALLDKILKPGELLTEDECEIVTSKEFPKAITSMANASVKLSGWYKENDSKDAIAFLSLNPSSVEEVEVSATE